MNSVKDMAETREILQIGEEQKEFSDVVYFTIIYLYSSKLQLIDTLEEHMSRDNIFITVTSQKIEIIIIV